MIVKCQIDMQDPAQIVLNADRLTEEKIHLLEKALFYVLY